MVTSRIWFTAAQRAELWERWKNGQSAAAISRALDRRNKRWAALARCGKSLCDLLNDENIQRERCSKKKDRLAAVLQ